VSLVSRRGRILLILALTLVVAACAAPLWLPWFGWYLVRSGPPVKADMIVVLAGDQSGQRILEGAELAREGYANRVLVSGPGPEYGLYESELAINYAVSHGYPRELFIPFAHTEPSTVREVRAILPVLRRMHVRTIDVVTSSYHTRRAGKVFRRYAPDFDVHMVAAPSFPFEPGSWWKNREGAKLFAIEWAKTVAYWIGL